MQTNLKIKSISNADGKTKITDNITYVNPNLSDANAKLLAMKINALTMNTYDTTERIDTRDLGTDSKIDYTVQLQTNKLNTSTGEQPIGFFNEDTNEFPLNITPLKSASNPTVYFRLLGLSQAEAPVLTITTSNSTFGIEHRATTYGTQQNLQSGMRGLYQMDLNVIDVENIVAGDSFVVKVNVLGDATHNPYTRTVTYNFIEWSAGGE